MKYVSGRPSIKIILIFALLCLAAPLAYGESGDNHGSASAREREDFSQASPELDIELNHDIKQNQFTDTEITEKCQATIAGNINLVTYTTSSGEEKKAPRCVQIYENMREMAEQYQTRQNSAREEISNASTECSNQANCFSAGSNLTNVAIASHEDLAAIAERAEIRLNALVHNK